MSYRFAQVSDDNVVLKTLSLPTEVVTNPSSGEVDLEYGKAQCARIIGPGGTWVTSTLGPVEDNYQKDASGNPAIDGSYEPMTEEEIVNRQGFARVGFIYDADTGHFMPPQPYASWTYDRNIHQYVPPLPYPTTHRSYLDLATGEKKDGVDLPGTAYVWNEEAYQADNTKGWEYLNDAERKLDGLGLSKEELKQILGL